MSTAGELEAKFLRAVDYLNNNKIPIDQSNQLYFYGHFKQATVGVCNTKQPSFFDFVNKAKWSAWSALKNLSKEDAMMNYIGLLDKLVAKWDENRENDAAQTLSLMEKIKIMNTKPDEESDEEEEEGGVQNEEDLFEPEDGPKQKRKGYGPVMSRIVEDRAAMEEAYNTKKDDLCYWVCENNVEIVKEIIENFKEGESFTLADYINKKDADGRNALIWSCDRGNLEMTNLLLAHGAQVNAKDDEGMTPLHYACLCAHADIIELLILTHHADTTIEDASGSKPRDLLDTSDEETSKILHLFN